MRRLRCTALCLLIALLATNTVAVSETGDAGAAAGDARAALEIVTPEEHRRGEDQTYLTYPEWFLVFSPAEYARFLDRAPVSEFPYFGHIDQFWESYSAMVDAMEDRYPFNFGYHVMVFVIGTSTTVEYALKAGYEVVFGRWFEGEPTPEDELAAWVAQDYVDFILTTPWYEYDFFGALGSLWFETPMTGPRLARKWERRFALTTEYLVKGGYAILIKAGTQAGYEPPIPLTTVLLEQMPDLTGTAGAPPLELELLDRRPDGTVLVALPRYDAFKDNASQLAGSGADFIEIAGNRGMIVTSLLSEQPLQLDIPHTVLMEQPILTEQGRRRFVLETSVADLAGLLRDADSQSLVLEHVYDY